MTTDKPGDSPLEPEQPETPEEGAPEASSWYEESEGTEAEEPEAENAEAEGTEAEDAEAEETDAGAAATAGAAGGAAAAEAGGRGRRGGPPVATGSRGEGYRGSLPPRNDRLAGPWIIIVAAIFVLVLVLSALGLPSGILTGSPSPVPSALPSGSAPVPSASLGPSLVPSP